MDDKSKDKPIPLSEVAEWFGVTVPTVISWAKAGVEEDANGEPIKLHAFKLGRAYRTTWNDVEEFTRSRGQSRSRRASENEVDEVDAYYAARLKAELGIS